jgi:hypothetical protein
MSAQLAPQAAAWLALPSRRYYLLRLSLASISVTSLISWVTNEAKSFAGKPRLSQIAQLVAKGK